jgi:hypothetical protein
MFRKMILVIAAMAATTGTVALSSTEASARWGGRGWGGGHFAFGSVGRVGGWGWRGPGWGWRRAGWGWGGWGGIGLVGIGIPVAYSCWRWVPTSWGAARIWVC